MTTAPRTAPDPAPLTQHREVDVSNPEAVARCSAALGTTDEALLKAVQVVGTSLDRIKDYLGSGGMAGDQSDA